MNSETPNLNVPIFAMLTLERKAVGDAKKHTAFPSSLATRSFQMAILLVASLGIGGCNEYWWQRGQPASSQTVFARSKTALEESLRESGSARSDITPVVKEIESSLGRAVETVRKRDTSATDLLAHLSSAKTAMMRLEGLTSIGSRAAQGELNGELRSFIAALEQGTIPEAGAVTLFAARTLRFLANEVTVPAPVKAAS